MNLVTWARGGALFALVAPLTACASVSPKPAFQDTAALVQARTGRPISWNRGGTEDAAVSKQIHALLSRELSVDGAIQVALLNNPTLQATYEDLSIAQADLVQAGLLQNPVFGGGLLLSIAGAATTGGMLSVTEDFLSVFLLAARKRVADARLRATEKRVADAVLRMTYEVASAFYELGAAAEVALLRKTVVDAADGASDLARRQHAAGNISDLDLVNQEAASEQARTDLARSDAQVVAAREGLTRLLGVWGADAGFQIARTLPELPSAEVGLDDLESRAMRRRLDLAAARDEVAAVAGALSLTKKARWLGSTSLGATYERAPEGFTVAGPSLELEVPLFDQKQAVVARLEAQLRAALGHETALGVDVRSEVRLARARVVAMRAVVARYARVLVPLRERAVALSQEQYDAMLLGAYQLLQVKQNEVNARRELIEALRDYWVARAELERATGGTSAAPDSVPNAGPQLGARP